MHSAAAVFFPAAPMKHCAGAVMMATVMDGSVCSVGGGAVSRGSMVGLASEQPGAAAPGRVPVLAPALPPPRTSCRLHILLPSSPAQVPDAAASPRPLMHLLGALDGQLRLPRAAWAAARLAPLAAQVGARQFAATRPFAVLPGLNHASFSNGAPWRRN